MRQLTWHIAFAIFDHKFIAKTINYIFSSFGFIVRLIKQIIILSYFDYNLTSDSCPPCAHISLENRVLYQKYETFESNTIS